MVSVRVAEPHDAARVSAVLAAAYSAIYPAWYAPDILAAALPSIASARPELLASGRYFLAEANDRPVACGGWSLEWPGTRVVEEGVAHARHFATDPAFVRRGLGGAILDFAIEAARAAACVRMECDASLPAERFYAAHGFVAVTKRDVVIGGAHRFPVVHMRRSL